MDKDHIEISQNHLFSSDERRYIRAYAHALVAVAIELRRLNDRAEAQNTNHKETCYAEKNRSINGTA